MNSRISVSAIAAALIAGAAFAQAPEATPPAPPAAAAPDAAARPARPEEGLRKADTNKDGKVSFDELKVVRPQATKERFDMMDKNHDGFIGPEDRPQGKEAKAGNTARAGADPEARRQMMNALIAADADHDGKTSFAEVATAKPGFAQADFDRVDTNKDGFITAADAPHAPKEGEKPHDPAAGAGKAARKGVTPEQREALRERILKADTDKDGYVTREEARTGLPNVTDERFKALDRNGDGKLGPDDRPKKTATAPAN